MSGQAGGAGGAKSRTPPNPNFGGGVGTDNSNGVYNGVQSSSAPTTSTNPAAATQTPLPAASGQTTATASATPAGKGTTKGGTPPAPAGAGSTPQQTAQSSYASTMGAALKGQPVPLPGGMTMGDMSGGNMGVPSTPEGGWTAENGGVPVAMGQVWNPNNPNQGTIYGPPPQMDEATKQKMAGGATGAGDMQRGIVRMPGSRATTDQRIAPQIGMLPPSGAPQQPTMMNYDQWLASRPAGQPLATNDYQAYTETFNQPKQGVGTPPATPPPGQTNPFGGTGLQQKLQAKGTNPQAPAGPGAVGATPNAPETQGAGTDWISKLTANGGTSATPVKGNSQDWQSAVKKLAGDPNADPVTLMQQAYAGGSATQNGANMRRYLESNGIDPYVAANLENAFGSSGADSEMGAKRVGLTDRFQAGGANGLKDPALQAQNNLNWYLKNAPTSPFIPALRAQLEKARAVPKTTGAVNTAAGTARRAEEAGLETAAMDTAKTQNDAQAAQMKKWAESDNPDDPTGYMPGSPQDRQVRAARAARIAAKGTAPNDTATEHQRGT